jgi:hypothetical protein
MYLYGANILPTLFSRSVIGTVKSSAFSEKEIEDAKCGSTHVGIGTGVCVLYDNGHIFLVF